MNSILFNGLQYSENGAGISRYTEELIRQFINEDYSVDILMRNEFRSKYQMEKIFFNDKNITSSMQRIIEEQYKQAKKYKQYELVHFPDYASPVFYNGLKVVTIHDMAMHTMRDKYTLAQNITKNILLMNTIKHADRLICISEFTKKEILNYYPEVEPKVRVVYSGIAFPEYRMSIIDEKNILEKLNINKEYILYVGTVAPHKNIEKLIMAYKDLKSLGYPHQLVIVGKKGWLVNSIYEIVKKENLQDDIVFTGFVAEDELEVLYRRATCFISVSLYEGFGFPPLEAMGRGCPVIVSEIEVFKEICQDNVLYCEPTQVIDIVKKLEMMIKNDKLRDELRNKGLTHVNKFSWKKTAQQTMMIYKELLDNI